MDDHATETRRKAFTGDTPEFNNDEGREEFDSETQAFAGDVRASMQRMTSAFYHQAEDVVTNQQSMIAAVMRDFARSLRNPEKAEFRTETQRFLGGDGQPAPILVSAFADALETSASRVESIDINRVTGEATRFLREQPLAAAGMAALAGLAIARFARTAAR